MLDLITNMFSTLKNKTFLLKDREESMAKISQTNIAQKETMIIPVFFFYKQMKKLRHRDFR